MSEAPRVPDRRTVALIAYLLGSLCFIVGSGLMLYEKVKR